MHSTFSSIRCNHLLGLKLIVYYAKITVVPLEKGTGFNKVPKTFLSKPDSSSSSGGHSSAAAFKLVRSKEEQFNDLDILIADDRRNVVLTSLMTSTNNCPQNLKMNE